MRNFALHASGLVMGAANTVRHKRQGYVTPRPFSAADIERTLDHAFEVVDRLEADGEVTWTDRRVLECGPGSDLATGAVILDRGAAEYQAVDLFDNRGQAASGLYAALERRLGAPVAEDRLGFTQTTFPDLAAVRGPYDLIVSNAVLEHIDDVPGLFSSFARISSDSGRMVHHVDAQTHMRWIKDADPLNILRYSDATYRRLLHFPGAPNRLRASDFSSAAESSGWRVARIVPAIEAPADYLADLRIARRFRGADDLGLLAFTLVAERVAPSP